MVNETGQLSNQVKNTHMGFVEVFFEVGGASLSSGISMVDKTMGDRENFILLFYHIPFLQFSNFTNNLIKRYFYSIYRFLDFFYSSTDIANYLNLVRDKISQHIKNMGRIYEPIPYEWKIQGLVSDRINKI